MARGGGGAEEGGSERRPGETAAVVAAAGPAQRRLPRCLGRAGGEGREGGGERRGQLRQGLRRLPVGLSLGSGPGPPSGSGSAAWIPALAARPTLAGPIPPAAGGGAGAGPRGAGPGPATRSGAADDERWRRGPGGGGSGAPLCDSHTSNMASITTPRIQKPALRTAPAFQGRWRPQSLMGLVVSRPRPRGLAAGGLRGSRTTNPGVPRAGRPGFRVLI
ncbi:spidroin-2 [Caloenas nicobarica]|uniref:spidroin-2 n=1 Tax=Caloenas nicobarica TaxID=187106 RepID=UPI0032B701C9